MIFPRASSIVPLVAHGTEPLTMAQATDLHRAFRTPIDASRITDIATDLAKGQTTERAFAEIEADLDILFAKWAALIDGRV